MALLDRTVRIVLTSLLNVWWNSQWLLYLIWKAFWPWKLFIKPAAASMFTNRFSLPQSSKPLPVWNLLITRSVSPPSTILSCNSKTGWLKTNAMMFVWNLQVSIGFLFLIFYRRITSGLLFLTPNISSLKKATRQIVKMPNGFVIYICVELLSLPLFPRSNEPSGHSF